MLAFEFADEIVSGGRPAAGLRLRLPAGEFRANFSLRACRYAVAWLSGFQTCF
uniref:Uncharacterized protein n=1 Tax=Macrostomum lignano TaxID=282301 RepID=A0A1I8INZ8_9PLAT